MSYINTLAQYRITDGWAAHRARGSLGGVDFACAVGTPIPAPCDGKITNIANNGTGGHTVNLWHADGSRDQFMHLSGFVKEGNVKQGDIIGYSGGKKGAPGAGSSTGPHIHWHYILKNGTRVNPLEYVGKKEDAPAKPAKLSGWKGIQSYLKKNWDYSGAIDGIPGQITWKSMQRMVKKHYGYMGPVNGIPGKNTWKATQKWLARYYGYNGAIDGIPGPRTNAALERAGADLG